MADSRRAAEDAAAEEEAEAAAAERAAISFAAADAPVAATTAAADAAAAPTSVAASLAELEAERALHRRRAERFGGEFVDPVRSFFRSSRDERVVFTAASARGPTARRRRRRSRDGPSSPLAPPLPPLRPRFSLPRPSAARKTREAAPLVAPAPRGKHAKQHPWPSYFSKKKTETHLFLSQNQNDRQQKNRPRRRARCATRSAARAWSARTASSPA